MSASSIDRWNAIPMLPSASGEHISTLKRARPDDDDDNDNDDVSIVSRSPSPSPMDTDGDIHSYDEYIRGAPQEVITVETRIKPTNKGFAMLEKLGWTQGQPLGVSGDGRVDPIPFQIKRDSTGLGKTSQDVRMIETTVSQRRGLDSERQQKETEDQRRAREELVARKSALESELSTTLKAFYCTLCDKQFKNVAQYDEHTNSYAHHHKARYKDMQANVRLKPKGEADKRKEKERKREEKELRKIAKANGIKMAKPMTATPILPADSPMDIDPSPLPKKGGWATVSSPPVIQAGGRNGWTSVDPPVPPLPQTPTVSDVPTPASHVKPYSTPSFRNAGWTSLDTGSSQSVPSPLSTEPPLLPFNDDVHSRIPPKNVSSSLWPRATQPLHTPPLAPNTLEAPQPIRSGWQQFQSAKRRS